MEKLTTHQDDIMELVRRECDGNEGNLELWNVCYEKIRTDLQLAIVAWKIEHFTVTR